METLRVSAGSRPNAVAGAVAALLRQEGAVEVQAIGPHAVNQAVKAIAIARAYLAQDELDLTTAPSFVKLELHDEERTAVRFDVVAVARPASEPRLTPLGVPWRVTPSARSSTVPADPRGVVLDVLVAVATDGAHASVALDRALAALPRPEDRSFATDVVYGTLRWAPALDAALAARLRDPDALPARVRAALRAGAFERGVRGHAGPRGRARLGRDGQAWAGSRGGAGRAGQRGAAPVRPGRCRTPRRRSRRGRAPRPALGPLVHRARRRGRCRSRPRDARAGAAVAHRARRRGGRRARGRGSRGPPRAAAELVVGAAPKAARRVERLPRGSGPTAEPLLRRHRDGAR